MANSVALRNEKGLQAFAQTFVKTNQIAIPTNYDVAGAAAGLFLQLQSVKDKNGKFALEVVTENSLKQAIMYMVTNGLDPRKKQCYPIVYGDTLQMQVGYFGNQKMAQTYNIALSDFHAQVIYKGDTYVTKIENDGRKVLVKHEQPFGVDRTLENIIGAYSIVLVNGKPDLEEMTIGEIKTSWAQSRSGGDVHKKFSGEMAKKTVINRHAKRFINVSDDSAIMEEEKAITATPLDIDKEIKEEEFFADVETGEIIHEEQAEPIVDEKPFDKKASDFDETPEQDRCVDCGEIITDEKVVKYSNDIYGDTYCRKCQKNHQRIK